MNTESPFYASVENTTWPINVGPTEHNLRYGTPVRERNLHAASVVAAYSHLTDPEVSEDAAIAALRRARKAQVQG